MTFDFDYAYKQFDLTQQICEQDNLYAAPQSYHTDKDHVSRVHLANVNKDDCEKLVGTPIPFNLENSNYDYITKLAYNKDKLINFRNGSRDSLISMNYPSYIDERSPDSKIYQEGMAHLKNIWVELLLILDNDLLNECNDNTVGHPILFNFRRNRVTSEFVMRHIYFYAKAMELTGLSRTDEHVILEIGGGYGGLGKLFLDFNDNAKYIIIDLPTCLLLQEYFYKNSFPGKRVATVNDFLPFFNEKKIITKNDLNEFDIILLPPPFISLIEDEVVDLSINTHSMMEMNIEQIQFYYEQLWRLTKGYFYQCNRLTHKTGFPYTYKDWPVEKWTVISSSLQWGMKHMLELCLKK
jgi:putative sugar O-methyltransferase